MIGRVEWLCRIHDEEPNGSLNDSSAPPCPTRLASAGAFITAGPCSFTCECVSALPTLGTACIFSHPTPRQYATPYGSRPRCFASSLGCLLQRTRIAPHSFVDTHAPSVTQSFSRSCSPCPPKKRATYLTRVHALPYPTTTAPRAPPAPHHSRPDGGRPVYPAARC